MLGRAGHLFFEGVNCKCEQVRQLQALSQTVCGKDNATYNFVLVEQGTFFPVREGKDEHGTPYSHWTIIPDQVTSPEKAQRIKALRALWTSMDSRLSKFLGSDGARASVRIMEEERKSLVRPDHWGRVLKWVMDIQNRFAKDWDSMSEVERWEVRVFAMATGAVEGAAHKDFYQASNIVDFLEMPSRDALRQEMDRRSDPAFYQVSQLNRRLAAQNVTSDRTIGLSWDGRYTDDLDIHVVGPSGQECNYSNKCTYDCVLDFDANVSEGEAEPCENVSCKTVGTYKVFVNNYTRRTHGQPIHFTIVIREKGLQDVIIESVWTQGRRKGNMLLVTTHTFGSAERKEEEMPALSAKAASRIKANDAHWQANVGEPKAYIATVKDLSDMGCPVIVCQSGDFKFGDDDGEHNDEGYDPEAAAAAASAASSAVGAGLMAMVSNAGKQKKEKKLLSDHCAANPTTVEELVTLLMKDLDKGKNHDVAIEHRDHAPGYLVDIETKTGKVRKSKAPAACHYQRKFALPSKPVSTGDARMDRSWGYVRPDGKVTVGCVTKVEGKYFFVLEGAKLPQNESFPLAGGFYPTDLTSDCHVHRERWTYYHSQLKPVLKGVGTPAIGTFLTGEKTVVYLDGVKMTLRV